MTTHQALLKYKNEADIIGRLLAGYTDLELSLLNCVQIVREDFDTVLKVMFRTRGETARINVADALGRQYYHELGLGGQFELAICAMRYCLRIRNDYAHCVWWDDLSDQLAFANIEEVAKSNELQRDFGSLTTLHVNVSQLCEKEKYFQYTDDLLGWVNFEGRHLAGKIPSNVRVFPEPLAQPSL